MQRTPESSTNALTGACVLACTLWGCADCDDARPCADTLTINFEKASPWTSGDYSLAVQYDDTSAACDVHLPASFASQAEEHCNNHHVALGMPSRTSIAGLTIYHDRPDEVYLQWTLDGVVFLATSISAEYELREDEDPRCVHPCDSANETVPVP